MHIKDLPPIVFFTFHQHKMYRMQDLSRQTSLVYSCLCCRLQNLLHLDPARPRDHLRIYTANVAANVPNSPDDEAGRPHEEGQRPRGKLRPTRTQRGPFSGHRSSRRGCCAEPKRSNHRCTYTLRSTLQGFLNPPKGRFCSLARTCYVSTLNTPEYWNVRSMEEQQNEGVSAAVGRSVSGRFLRERELGAQCRTHFFGTTWLIWLIRPPLIRASRTSVLAKKCACCGGVSICFAHRHV